MEPQVQGSSEQGDNNGVADPDEGHPPQLEGCGLLECGAGEVIGSNGYGNDGEVDSDEKPAVEVPAKGGVGFGGPLPKGGHLDWGFGQMVPFLAGGHFGVLFAVAFMKRGMDISCKKKGFFRENRNAFYNFRVLQC